MAKKKRNMDDGSEVDVGLVMTVSLFLILLTFFILLNSIAVIDDRKMRLSLGSLIGAFGSLPGGLSPLNTGGSVMPPSAPMMDEEMQMNQLMSLMAGADKIMAGQLKLEKVKEKAIITINGKILFHKGGIKLIPSSFPLLNKLCDLSKKEDYQIEIIGHTDNIPAEAKGYNSNWEISTLMATQVLKYFVTEGDIPPHRLTAYGCGSNISIATNDTIKSRAQNRRVDIVLHFKAPEYIKRIHRKKPSGIFTYKKFDFRVF